MRPPGGFLFLIFSVVWRLVSVCPEQEPADPVRGLSHLPAYGVQGGIHAAFDNQFVMDMPHDTAVAEGLHGMHEKVPAQALHDVLHELWPPGFQALPFFRGSHAFVGDGFAAEAVFANPGLYIGQPAPGGEGDEEHAALTDKTDAVGLCSGALPDGGFRGGIDIPPEPYDVRVGCPPGSYITKIGENHFGLLP